MQISKVYSLLNFPKLNAHNYLHSDPETFPSPQSPSCRAFCCYSFFPLFRNLPDMKCIFIWFKDGTFSSFLACRISIIEELFIALWSQFKIKYIKNCCSLGKSFIKLWLYKSLKLEETLERGGYGKGVVLLPWQIRNWSPGIQITHHYSLFVIYNVDSHSWDRSTRKISCGSLSNNTVNEGTSDTLSSIPLGSTLLYFTCL